MVSTLIYALAFASLASAHTAAFAPGMYCRNGTIPGEDNNNNNTPVNPLHELSKVDWWFQHDRNCDAFPPVAGEFLELPAGKSVTVELAHNRAATTLSYDGRYTTLWPDGENHTEPYVGIKLKPEDEGCLSDGALHATNESNAAGTAFAISYQSDLSKVTIENLVVFTTLEHTPFKRIAKYQVPAGLPACPPGGCHCAWLWVPDKCGTSNMYMQGFKCKVTGATSTIPLAVAKAPIYCKDDPTKCVQGAKQMIAAYQKEGNNIVTQWPISPGYNIGLGWKNGAQNDIFQSVTSQPTTTSSSTTVAPKPTTLSTTSTKTTTTTTTTLSTPTTIAPKPTTLSTSTKTTTTTTTTTVKAAAPTGPASGTIYLTTGQNWDGFAENWTWKNGDCKVLTSRLTTNIGSAGPNVGTCTFFDGGNCDGKSLLTISYPGKSSLGNLGKKFKSFSCK